MGLIFDGVDLEERFGLVTDGADTWTKPERDRELISVPGRNGDLILDHGRWNNVDIKYNFLIKDGWQNKFEEFARWLCAHRGYFKLEDPQRHPDVYRMAEFADSIDPKLWFTTRTGIFTLTFNCKPQQYLYSGDTPIKWIVPEITGFNWRSSYIPAVVGSKISVTPHIDPSVTDTVTVTFKVFNASKVERESSGGIVARDGVTITYSITASESAYWQILANVRSANNNDLVSFTVVSETVVDGSAYPINAYFARRIVLRNKTGYETKPLFRSINTKNGMYMGITNYVSEKKESYWSYNISDYSAVTSECFMDCDMQYLYYDYVDSNGYPRKGNLGQYLFITAYNSAAGKALTYPKFGSDEIEVYTYLGLISDSLGILEIYPRWWRV